ncbi:MAG: zinc ribbon domain-containing protein [Eubacteriales bacterium]
MAQICPKCGSKNDDGKLFCGACGDPLGGDLKLIMDLDKSTKKSAEKAKEEHEADVPLQAKEPEPHDEHYAPKKLKKEDTTGNVLIFLCVLGLILVTGGIVYLLLQL